MILVIAEKPSVAQTIAAVLGAKEKKDGFLTGSGYIVSWCVGHLVGLAEAAAYREQYKKWSYDSLPILPQEWKYTVAADKEKQFKTLKELMHRADVSEVVNACDAGREGELIFRFVYEMAGCKKPMRRLWISSMEDSAIKEGFSRLKNGEEYDALFASALCRAKADWLIGINATRLFSVLYNHTLNVGRVQTPTLKMLVDRDAAITTFKKEKYYHVRLALSGAEAASEKLSDRSEADRLKAACEASKAVCTSLVKEKKTAAPPKLFDLTSLQREANRLFGYTAKQTLDLAQALYEKAIALSFEERGGATGADQYVKDATKKPIDYVNPMDGADIKYSHPAVSTITIAWEPGAEYFERNLERIITQKWIAIFPLGLEAWAEHRRTGYPKLLPAVENKDPNNSVNVTIGPRRLPFPADEYTGNPKYIDQAVQMLNGPDAAGTKLWWDKKDHSIENSQSSN